MKVAHGALQKRYTLWKDTFWKDVVWKDSPYVMGIDWAAMKFPDAFFQPAYPMSLAWTQPKFSTQPLPLLPSRSTR